MDTRMTKTLALLAVIAVAIAAASYFYFYRDGGNGNEETNLVRERQTATSTEAAVSRAKVEEHIKANISTLSPEKEVLGGTFFVTDIAFRAGNKGTVTYEDGHNLFVADFSYATNSKGDVAITSFSIVPEGQTATTTGQGAAKPNFSKPGNLVKSDAGEWVLVYEEPGKPALRAELQFSAASICDGGQGNGSCESVEWKIGERVRAEGELVGTTLQVTKVTKL